MKFTITGFIPAIYCQTRNKNYPSASACWPLSRGLKTVVLDRKGDYTDWQTNYTPEISRKNLERLAVLLEMTPDDPMLRNQMLSGMAADLEQGAAVEEVPESLAGNRT